MGIDDFLIQLVKYCAGKKSKASWLSPFHGIYARKEILTYFCFIPTLRSVLHSEINHIKCRKPHEYVYNFGKGAPCPEDGSHKIEIK